MLQSSFDRTEHGILKASPDQESFAGKVNTDKNLTGAKARWGKGPFSIKQEKSNAAVTLCNRMIDFYYETGKIELQKLVARAMLLKGVLLHKLARKEDSIATFEGIINSYSSVYNIKLQHIVAKSLLHKGIALNSTGRSYGAIATFDEVIKRYQNIYSTEFQKLVVKAHTLKQFILYR